MERPVTLPGMQVKAHRENYDRLVADLVLAGATQEQAETRALRLLAGENA
jgi:hypothetical protein